MVIPPVEKTWTWWQSGGIDFDVGILVDNLTVVMLVVVTGVSALVHLYSTSYMHGEIRYTRFFAYLSLFTFSMLGLVITSNLRSCSCRWELVGVCSYFLIGFYIEKKSAGDAAEEGVHHEPRRRRLLHARRIMIVFSVLSTGSRWRARTSCRSRGSTSRSAPRSGRPALDARRPAHGRGILVLHGLRQSKSAQFPLHIWLPDAMEGPTPVSALIHAATMVAAGVYLIARMFPLIVGQGYLSGDYFHGTPLMVVAIVGGFTSLFAGSIALVQQDLKKGLAYSTVSQLGYMAMAVGVGSMTAACSTSSRTPSSRRACSSARAR